MKMNLKNLQEKIKVLNEKTKPQYRLYSPTEKEILTKTVKLNEEVGELANDILSVLKLQRRAKLEKFDKRNIYEEFADVIITTIQLAQAAGVNIDRAVNDKLKKIEYKYMKKK
jgi:NTP pyrophosphatase (non-canonical NTP hydrolase)